MQNSVSSTPSPSRKRAQSVANSSTHSSPSNPPPPPLPLPTATNQTPKKASPPPPAKLKSTNHSPVDESLQSFKLLQALRTSDTESILNLLKTQYYPKDQPHPSESKLTPLHLAVRCATYEVAELVLNNSPANVLTSQDSSGQTPLHIACSLSRTDVVSLLLAHPQVDDSLRDYKSRTCLEVCKSAQVAKLIQAGRDQLNGSFLALLSAYIASPLTSVVSPSVTANQSSGTLSDVIPSSTANNNHESAADQLYKFMNLPRCKSIDFNLKEEQNGTTLLHEAAKRKDVNLINLAISRGADVLARDKRNKMPIDVALDEKVKTVLRQAASSEGRALKAISEAKALSPDTHQSTTSFAGSTNLTAPPSSGTFVQPILKGYLSKWTNMARGYSTRWIVLEKGFLSYYRDQNEEGKTLRGSIAMSVAIVVGPDVTKDKLRFEVSSKLGNSYPRFYLKGAHPLEVMRWVDALKQAIEVANQLAPPSPEKGISRKPSSALGSGEKRNFVSRHLRNSRHIPGVSSSSTRRDMSMTDTTGRVRGNTTDPDSPPRSVFAQSTSEEDDNGRPEKSEAPFENELDLLVQSLKAHIEMTDQLLNSLTIPSGATTPQQAPADPLNTSPDSSSTAGINTEDKDQTATASQRQIEVKHALKRSVEDLGVMFDDYLTKINKRERYHIRRYEEESQAKRLWEENMQALLASQAEMERQLQSVARDSSRRKKQLKSLRAGINESNGAINTSNLELDKSATVNEKSEDGTTGGTSAPSASGPTSVAPRRFEQPPDSSSEDEDDEFFEAIETGTIAVEPMTVTKSLASDRPLSDFVIEDLKEGYETKRTTLPITADDRPSVSLWSILKNSIGKDLTKISFPVSFNEPISMLQRMAEDMQFSECLDAAAEQPDSLIRMAYVAGFAMSNYSSTVGRLAKPFNPLLGETYEYIDPDKEFRYLSEQVSHHPPTSACYAESPRWSYFGETDAKNKFTGKSFEIRPTGVAHAVLNVPKTCDGVQDYPPSKRNPNRVEEHYSWKKVTTIISNFLMGSPTIDHYGDMEITNHRTQEKCILTFKPRGWRGKDANEVKGCVYDKDGKLVWELAGKWTTQLIGRRAGSASGDLGPDENVTASRGREYLQLWKNTPSPPNMPFNLTTFAMTLNAMNSKLKNYLPPTDCRLRPDQHAFEKGQWDKANDLKISLEEFQRLTKRKRELGELPDHQPRWFTQVDDPDSGELTWDAVRSPDNGISILYWEERNRVGVARKQNLEAEWADVAHIFGEFESVETDC
ncbi:hypothetical protein MJO29_011733 [Puccinia striiformis f. sp. tritici]|uniref:hypothetical protein n=1 Tax=Puccinia striiformis f. sp. tritici TaxID=168172 RepID=UPI00200876C8|nr:hypothetical protein Pst134EA_022417 [Puccinia striiformis f. sp. tritici]KAH9454928.1 hypothetical protein Pst134EA_022417 [Puccinia striiformis f. sp. tritici]KAI7945345.1 hypothetical protein MJO29_011733 [Puccinia striiformis f. sp. tritici]